MPTVAELAAREHREIAYLLVIEGVPFAFTDRREIAGSGPASWIGTADGERRVLEGLTVPSEITFSTSLETGYLESDDGATFTIQDFDGEIIEFLRVQTEVETVGQALTPKDDPAPAELVSADGLTPISIHGKWVNGEAISEKGARNIFQCLPGDPMPGLSHAAFAGDLQYLAPSVVTSSPTFLEGRRCALYRIFKDTSSTATNYTAWPSWADQYASGDSLAWYGTLREAAAEARTWRFTCDGPSSWLRRQLNATRPVTWERVSTTLTLDTSPGSREDLVSLEFVQSSSNSTVYLGGATYFSETLDVLPASGSPEDYRVAIAARIATVSSAMGTDITWTTSYDSSVDFKQGYVSLKTSNNGFCAIMSLSMHEKIWRALGFDPVLQQGTAPFSDEFRIDFVYANSDGKLTAQYSATSQPAPGYVTAVFSTLPFGIKTIQEGLNKVDNEGAPRVWSALNPFGPMFLQPGGQQEIVVGLGPGTHIEGQLNRPPAAWTFSNGGGVADSTGYFAFRAQYKESLDSDPITMVQVAKGSWGNEEGSYGTNLASQRQLFIERWLDPRWFGIDRKPLSKVWASVDLEFAPLAFVGVNLNAGDRADAVLLRTLLSTGTASWLGYEGQNATRTLGVNAHPDAYDEASDVEIADLGLSYPASLIDGKSFVKTALEIPDGLLRCKYGFVGSFDSQELIARILAPRGWGLGMVRGKLRLFQLAKTLSYEDAEVVIGPDDFASDDPMFVERVNLRPLTARDKFSVEYGTSAVDDAGSERELVERTRAQDPGSRTRASNAEMSIDGAGLVPVALWRGAIDAPPQWASAWAQLWSTTIADWYGSPQVMVEDVPLLPSKARLLGPGSVVRFSSYFAPGREGAYGLTQRVGRVTKIVHDLEAGTAKVSILLQAGDPTTARRFAPVAWVVDNVSTVEERYDAAGRTFYCYRNYFGTEDSDAHDLSGFIEPDWLGVGGDTIVQGWQWNGRSWAQTFSFTSEFVYAIGDSISHKPGTMTGTFKQGQPCMLVLAPYDSQPANSWTRPLFSVITRPNTTFGASNTKGFKLV